MGKPPKIQPWMIFLTCLALALGLQTIYPLPFPDFSWLPPLGWLVFTIGILFIVGGIGFLNKAFKAKGIWDPDQLVTDGFLNFSRNPFYLGVIFSVIGLGISQERLWLIAGGLLMLVLLSIFVIPHEERMLEDKFGKKYLEYMNKVRRWI